MADQQNPRRPPTRQQGSWLRPGGQQGDRLQPSDQQDTRQRPNGPQGRPPSWRGAQPGTQPTNSSMRSGRGGPGGPGGAGGPGRGPRSQWVMLAAIVGVLLAINLAVSSAALSPNTVRIPYKPTFLTQLKDGNIATISSTSLAYQGTFKKAVSYQGSAPDQGLLNADSVGFRQRPGAQEAAARRGPTINAKNPNAGASSCSRASSSGSGRRSCSSCCSSSSCAAPLRPVAPAG